MDVDQIPAVMVEAAADAYGDALMMCRYTQPGDEDDPDAPEDFAAHDRGEDLKVMRAVLAAALGVCEVREEEGGRCARDGDVFGQPGHAFSARSWLATRSYSQPDAHLIRRLVITTPAQPVTEGESTS